MRFSLFAGLWLASFAASTLPGQAPDAPAIDFSQLGPRVGQSPPDFSLTDQTGVRRTLKSILRPNGAVLVFYRSAEW
jgi:cytochrome oxidase Cu insertion factor (SCO1/SenC/PrrC family)